MHALFFPFISGYCSAKIIEINQRLTELQSPVIASVSSDFMALYKCCYYYYYY